MSKKTKTKGTEGKMERKKKYIYIYRRNTKVINDTKRLNNDRREYEKIKIEKEKRRERIIGGSRSRKRNDK